MKKACIFNLDMEVVQELESYGNKSGLVNQILRDYFDKTRPLKEVLQEKEQEATKLQDEAERIRLLIDKQQQAKRKRELEQSQDVSIKDWNIIMEHQKDAFETKTGRKMSEDEAREYLYLLQNGLVKNLIEFCIEKGIPDKKPKLNS